MSRWAALVLVVACATSCDPGAEFGITNECASAIEVAVVSGDQEPAPGDWFIIEAGATDRGSGVDLSLDEHSLHVREPGGGVVDVLAVDDPMVVRDSQCPDQWRPDSPDWLLLHYFDALTIGRADLAEEVLCRPMISPELVVESWAEDMNSRGLSYEIGSATPGERTSEVEFILSSDDGPLEMVAIVNRDESDGGLCLQETFPAEMLDEGR